MVKQKKVIVNSNMLSGAIVSSGLTQADVARQIGLSIAAFNNKINNKSEFKASEIVMLTLILKLTREEAYSIFFAKVVDC